MITISCTGANFNGRVTVNGKELEHIVRSVTADMSALDGVPLVRLELLGHDGLDVNFSKYDSIVRIIAYPGYEVQRTEEGDMVRFRAVRVEEKTDEPGTPAQNLV